MVLFQRLVIDEDKNKNVADGDQPVGNCDKNSGDRSAIRRNESHDGIQQFADSQTYVRPSVQRRPLI